MPGAEGYVFVNPAILAERDFAFGASIEIVEHGTGHTAFRDRAEIGNANNFRRGD
jgi:hypothetical protein